MKRYDKFHHNQYGDHITLLIEDVTQDRIYFSVIHTDTGEQAVEGIEWDSYLSAQTNMYHLTNPDQ
jgi:hypothetical protein